MVLFDFLREKKKFWIQNLFSFKRGDYSRGLTLWSMEGRSFTGNIIKGILSANPLVDGIPWILLLLIKVAPNPLVTKPWIYSTLRGVAHTKSKGQLNKTKNFERRRVSKLYIKKNLRGGIFQNIVMQVEHHTEVTTGEIGHTVKTKCLSYTHHRSDLGFFLEKAPESSEVS